MGSKSRSVVAAGRVSEVRMMRVVVVKIVRVRGIVVGGGIKVRVDGRWK